MSLRRFNYIFFPLGFLSPVFGFLLYRSRWEEYFHFSLVAAAVLALAGAIWAWGVNRYLIPWLGRKWPIARVAALHLLAANAAVYLFLCVGAIYDGKFNPWNLVQFLLLAPWVLIMLSALAFAFLLPCIGIYSLALKRLRKEEA